MNPLLGRAVAAVGLTLTCVAIWIDFEEGFSIWDFPNHQIGIFMLVLSVLAGVLPRPARSRRSAKPRQDCSASPRRTASPSSSSGT